MTQFKIQYGRKKCDTGFCLSHVTPHALWQFVLSVRINSRLSLQFITIELKTATPFMLS